MALVEVQIVAFVLEHQPNIVACTLKDTDGREHRFEDKDAIFTTESLDRDSAYPRQGAIRCEILRRWRDTEGRELAHISTAPRVESTLELSEFTVLSSQISD